MPAVVKQQQEDISRNQVPTLFAISVPERVGDLFLVTRIISYQPARLQLMGKLSFPLPIHSRAEESFGRPSFHFKANLSSSIPLLKLQQGKCRKGRGRLGLSSFSKIANCESS